MKLNRTSRVCAIHFLLFPGTIQKKKNTIYNIIRGNIEIILWPYMYNNFIHSHFIMLTWPYMYTYSSLSLSRYTAIHIGIPTHSNTLSCNFNLALRKKLYWLFHLVAEEVKKEHPGAFGDDLRQEIFGEMVRDGMGCDENDPIFPWEYFDILVTCDTGLSKHCDHLNDWRPGYAHTSVYSYHCVIKGAEYKVSIIMTTRRAVGSAKVRIRKELNLK